MKMTKLQKDYKNSSTMYAVQSGNIKEWVNEGRQFITYSHRNLRQLP